MSSQRVVDDGGTKQFMCLKLSWKIRVFASHTGDVGQRRPIGSEIREFRDIFRNLLINN